MANRSLFAILTIASLVVSIVAATSVVKVSRAIAANQSGDKSGSDDCATDILFVVDATSSVAEYYQRHRQYVLDVVDGLTVSPLGHNVGVVVYSSKRRQQIRIPFGAHENNEQLISAIRNLPFFAGITETGAALVLAKKALNTRRPNVRTSVVVITDGFSYDSIAEPAAELRSLPDVRVFAVGIAEPLREPELLAIAGDPNHVLKGADSAIALARKLSECDRIAPPVVVVSPPSTAASPQPSVAPQVDTTAATAAATWSNHPCPEVCACGQHTTRVTEAVPVVTAGSVATTIATAPPTPVSGRCLFDVLFVIDASGSLTARFPKELELSTQLVDRLVIGEDNAHVALIRYAGRRKAKLLFDFNSHKSKDDLKQAIRNVGFIGGTTATNEALLLANDVLDRQRTARVGVTTEPLVVVFTDGFSQENPHPGAEMLHARGATVYAVGINEHYPISHAELVDIAGDEKRVFTEKTIGQFQDELDRITKHCQVQ